MKFQQYSRMMAIPAVALALGLSGCGGSSDTQPELEPEPPMVTPPPPPPPPTDQETDGGRSSDCCGGSDGFG